MVHARCGKRTMDDIPPLERRRRVSSASNMNKQIERICQVVETIGTRSNDKDSEYTIKNCIDKLQEMPEVTIGSDIYLFACRKSKVKEE